MTATVILGLVLALATAVSAVVAGLMRHRGTREAPAVEFRRPISTSLALFRHRWYVLGILVAIASWCLHVGALALAPITLVQSIIAAGLVFLAPVADRVFNLHVTRREWICVAGAAVGLALLAATIDGTADQEHSRADTRTLVIYVGVATAVALGTIVWSHSARAPGAALGVATGLLWGASDVTIKAITGRFDSGVAAAIVDPLVLVVVALSLTSLVVSARGLQLGPPVTVIALITAAGNIVTILSGFVVFHEPVPDGRLGLTLRILALVLVVTAAALTPPRAEVETA